MPNALSNFGLVSKGMDEGTEELNRLAAQKQQVETGAMGLEDLKRTQGNQAAYRTAVSTSDPEGGRIGAYHSLSEEALRRGDLGTAEQAREASRKLQDEGFGQLSMAAITGQDPAQAEKEFSSVGVHRLLPGSLEYGKDPKTGDILVKAKKPDGEDLPPFNATQYARMHGIIKPTVHPIPVGGSLAITEPGSPTQVVGGRDKAFSPSQEVIHVERTVDGEKKTYAYNVAEKKWIGGAPPGEEGTPPEAETGAHVRKNLPVLKAVDEAISKIPGAVNKMDLSDPLHPYYEWTPKGQAYATRAQKLYLANPNLPPEVIREIVSAPDLQARIVDGEEAEVRYKGKTYKLGSGTAVAQAPAGTPAAAATPAAAPAPAVAPKPAPKAEPKPAPKKDEPKREAPGTQAKSDDDIPDVVEPKSVAGTPKDRYQASRARQQQELSGRKDVVDAAAKTARAVADKLKPASPDEVFRGIVASKQMSRDDIPLIQEAIDSGKLTTAEELKAHRMIARLRPQTAGR